MRPSRRASSSPETVSPAGAKGRTSRPRRSAQLRAPGKHARDVLTGVRKRPQQGRAQATFDAVLEAAADLIARCGYAATTTNAIAERAGVSIGSLYQYFPHKTAILVSLLERHILEIQPVIADSLATLRDPHTPFAEGLRQLFVTLIDMHSHSPRLNEVLSEEVPHPPSIQRLRRKLEGGYVAEVAEILRGRGNLPPSRCDVAAQVIVVVAEAVTYWLAHSPAGSVDQERYVDEVVQLLGGYLHSNQR